MMTSVIKLPQFRCLHCQHKWTIRRPVEPKTCPNCNRVSAIKRVR